MMRNASNIIDRYVHKQAGICEEKGRISKDLFVEYGVKQGLRDEKGKGILTGLTNISQITAFKNIDGERVPCDGELLYRGYDVKTLADLKTGLFLRKRRICCFLESCLIMRSLMSLRRCCQICGNCRLTLRAMLL